MSALLDYRFVFIAILLLSLFDSPRVIAQDDAPIVVDASEEGSISHPDAEELNIFDSVSDSDSKAMENDDGASISAPSVSDIDNNSFFDANDLVPQGEMKQKGLVKVNPVTQPASKWIIVKEMRHADEKIVRLVSAERALALGRFDSALLMFDNLYERNKSDVRVLMGRAVVLQKIGRFDESMQMYESLSKLDPNNVDVKVNMLGLMGTRYPAVALRELLNLHNKNKSNVGVVSQIAILYAKTGDVRSALSYLGVASSIEPQNANHIFNMAIISDRAGDKIKAVSYYENALELDTIHGAGRSIPRDVIYERLARIR